MSLPEMLANNCTVVYRVGCKYLRLPTKLIAMINRDFEARTPKNDRYSISVLSRTSVEQHDCQDCRRKIDRKSAPRQMVPLEIFRIQLVGAQINAWPWSIQSLSASSVFIDIQFTHERKQTRETRNGNCCSINNRNQSIECITLIITAHLAIIDFNWYLISRLNYTFDLHEFRHKGFFAQCRSSGRQSACASAINCRAQTFARNSRGNEVFVPVFPSDIRERQIFGIFLCVARWKAR